jgi:predicted MFS family arabinose efflux permease
LGLLVLIGFSLQNVDIKLPVSPSFGERFRLLINQKIIWVIGLTCFISTACLGLYTYVAAIQSGAPHSLAVTLFAWGLGGFIGSSLVGIFIDLTKKPQVIMTLILVGLILTFITLPFTKHLPYLGLIPFFMWGALGWATTIPQQHILLELQEDQGTTLTALNASSIGLGSVFGTVIGGAVIALGLKEIYLPFLAAMLLFIVLICQLILIKSLRRSHA